jgi:5-methylcytosine-specific restriction endonuclease McrA
MGKRKKRGILKDQNGHCAICDMPLKGPYKRAAQTDHVVPEGKINHQATMFSVDEKIRAALAEKIATHLDGKTAQEVSERIVDDILPGIASDLANRIANMRENLQKLCANCNAMKADRPVGTVLAEMHEYERSLKRSLG